MSHRRRIFPIGQYYHVFNKSIAGFKIFDNNPNRKRFLLALSYYKDILIKQSLALVLRHPNAQIGDLLAESPEHGIKIICYTIMPTHYHLAVKILKHNFLSKYMNNVENSYTRFFNTKLERKGPLWQSKFQAVRVKSGEQFLHLTRYIHLNPTSSGLVDIPENWPFSSYSAYINDNHVFENLPELGISDPNQYRHFVKDQQDYQRHLQILKKLFLE
ncbi:hypothetical protein A2313_04055 [Candidatus Roizmanbacteria bacterium RIFOXYB2_FULL_41_10]|uniref:Transposase IS200-like domain-containing protein n=1 Tax=Candidatus Roizmanbacteria bacterium RIFOXYA1_FULL_41_12 TaxID=1802082 RepID=A0A1F7KFH6_9BACT|nr:MAG: hypothetical protein A2209_01100 [Candidatus Roizmanbacteria bacterium RIFOXYA1_FULL_41_12]OGK71129.1 MAG: hypothetical protein A2403_02860 [Candidatus Roizmanbacteria bacterium RIFOXYC1_FULL_41_16]OGK71753.1 MAG: hypothetical protein A2313_04055 [Candidatus Roizmanbacteria bacterium RIFOXYB2_FULL_41_10]OGK75965.1 MAG: hypothetical protein A2459_00610 [Candidatus Roizmanbacteria bacterium RIFOXYC2_FULL_41_10]